MNNSIFSPRGSASQYKRILKLSLPLSLEYLSVTSVTVIDNLTVGKLGPIAVSVAAAAGGIQIFLQFFLLGCESVISTLVSRHIGEEKEKRARALAALGLIFSVISASALAGACLIMPKSILSLFTSDELIIEDGVSFLRLCAASFPIYAAASSLLASLRGMGEAKLALYSSLSPLILKLILNPLLVFRGLFSDGMGLRGAATSTLITRTVLLILLIIIYIIKGRKKGDLGSFRVKDCAFEFFNYGAPIILSQTVWAISTLISTSVIGSLGREALSSYGISTSINSLAFALAMGGSSGVGITVSRLAGEGDKESAYSLSKKVPLIFMLIGCLTSALIYIIRGPYLLLFSVGTEVIRGVHLMTAALAIIAPFTAYQSVSLMGFIKSGGQSRFILITEVLSVLLLILPLTLLAKRLALPPPVVFLATKADQPIKCIVAYLKIKKRDFISDKI